jgi:CheY-like chemotaxis protein
VKVPGHSNLHELLPRESRRCSMTQANESALPNPADFCILVADDHAATRYVLSRVLRHAGFKTVEAASGAQALDLAQYVSGLLLDVNLPDLNGLEVCRLLRARRSTARLPIIQMSAVSVDELDRDAAHAAGANGYMTAPINPAMLSRAFLRLLTGSVDDGGVPGSPILERER